MKNLFELLSKHGGKIVSTNDLNTDEINQARASNRMYVDEDSLGYVWIPAFHGRFPVTVPEVEMFEWCYPLDVELPESLKEFVCTCEEPKFSQYIDFCLNCGMLPKNEI
jgi:hypothetical protein